MQQVNETDGFMSRDERAMRNLKLIVLALTAGVSTDQIARRGFISRTNVSNMVSRGAARLGVHGGRMGLLAYFIRKGEFTVHQISEEYLAGVREQFAQRSTS